MDGNIGGDPALVQVGLTLTLDRVEGVVVPVYIAVGPHLDDHGMPQGIEHVLVNGSVVYENRAHTGVRTGKVLRHK